MPSTSGRDLLTLALTRRNLVRRAFVVGLSAPAVAGLLAACGGSASGSTPTTTGSNTNAGGSTATAATTTQSSAAPTQSNTQALGGDLVIGWPGSEEPANMDFQIDPYTSTLIYNTWATETPLFITADKQYAPSLATKWEANADATKWTFTLRTDRKFQDGTAFDADAFVFNINRIMDPNTHSALLASNLGVDHFKSATAVDPTTVEIVYDAPLVTMVNGIASAPIWSPTAIKQYGAEFDQHLVGTGAFKFTQWVKGTQLKFVKNPSYNGGSPYQNHTGPAYLDSITVKFVGEQGVLGQVLQTNEVNVIYELPVQNLSTYSDKSKYQLLTGYQGGSGKQFVMNTSRPGLSDVSVRQALRYAYDPVDLNKTLYDGNYVTCYGPLTKYTRGYWQGCETAYTYDPAKSKSLLDAAGWAVGSSGVREKNGTALQLVLVLLGDQQIGEYLATRFSAIGVGLKVQIVPGPVQLQRATSGDFDLMYERLRGLEPDMLYSIWYSKNLKPGGWAWSRYQNDQLDSILEKTQTTSSETDRLNLFVQAQQIISQQALQLPTVDTAYYYASDIQVKGLTVSGLGYEFFVNDVYVAK